MDIEDMGTNRQALAEFCGETIVPVGYSEMGAE